MAYDTSVLERDKVSYYNYDRIEAQMRVILPNFNQLYFVAGLTVSKHCISCHG